MPVDVGGSGRARFQAIDGLTRRTALKGLGAAGAAALLASAGTRVSWAQEASPAAGDLDAYPEVMITARDYSFELPAEIAGGLTRVTLVNDGEMDHHAIFIRLNDGVTAEEVEAALAQPDSFLLVSLGDVLGGPNGPAPGGGAATVIMDLAPGNYEVVCLIPDDEGTPHYMLGMHAAATVTESTSSLTAPEADLTVELVDFGFDHLSMEVAAGPQIWEVTNVGQEYHELGLLMLAPGVPFELVQSIFGGPPPGAEGTPAGEAPAMDMASPEGETAASPEAAMGAPFVSMPSTAPKAPGMTNWLVLDLAPGNYVAICFVPSPANGFAPHFALGMLMPFTVE